MVSAKKMLTGLAVGALLSLPASAVAETQCGSTVTSACASVSAAWDGHLLTITAYNVSTGDAGSSVLTRLLLRVSGASGASLSGVYGLMQNGDRLDLSAYYRIPTHGRPPQVGGGDWNLDISTGGNDRNGRGGNNGACLGIINPAEASDLPCGPDGHHYDQITFVIYFDQIHDPELLAWAFHAQNLYDGASDWTTNPPLSTPEPITLILVGSGLLGVGLARRRKKYGEDPKDL